MKKLMPSGMNYDEAHKKAEEAGYDYSKALREFQHRARGKDA